MQLTLQHRKKITVWYCIIFYALMFYKLWNGQLLYQLEPVIYNTRFDMFTWFFMKTGVHQGLLNNHSRLLLFDIAYYSCPLLFLIAYLKNIRLSAVVSIVMLFTNWLYIQCYTLYPTNSIESYTAWMLFPFLFIATGLKSFYLILQGLRYFFLFFLTSAGIWKIVQQGVFNISQMSGVLLYQHKEYLISSSNWYSSFIYWLINHPSFSYIFYLGGTLLELTFAVGFFTKKYDTSLIIGFLLFLLMDILLMRIHYWEISAFVLTLIFSRTNLPEENSIKQR